ncbi:hypothetical protein ACFYMW_39160 [Streptomyces sp. NPDC006692]|uniref:hypothetical protein n=1 Tax=unclassified Streptomyces TaxID=2593676 RepID=UPI0036BECBA6
MQLLTPSELATLARQIAPQLGTQCRTLPDDHQGGAVRIVDDEGRALVLYQDEARPDRLFITARLPEAAEGAGIVLRPVTVAAPSTAAHAAAHIRRRLLPALARALAEFEARPTAPAARQPAPAPGIPELLPTDAHHAVEVLDALASPYVQGGDGWVIGKQVSRQRALTAAWWQTTGGAGDNGRAMVPFLADALRRAGLSTTEPRHGRWVFFTPPPPAPAHPRYTVQASSKHSGHWDVVDDYTGAAIRSSGDQERAGYLAEQLETEHDTQRDQGVASLDLPGLEIGEAESTVLRLVAVILARQGFILHGLDGVDHADVPGFLALSCPSRPTQVRVYRVLDPWGGRRPDPGQGAPEGGRRFDRALAAYARCLTRPGVRAVVDDQHVRVEFLVAPTLLGGPDNGSAGDKSALRLPVWLRPAVRDRRSETERIRAGQKGGFTPPRLPLLLEMWRGATLPSEPPATPPPRESPGQTVPLETSCPSSCVPSAVPARSSSAGPAGG